ncbi:MAG: hypothetical protein ABS81_06035 [Pseudonocardia sp. SCN 72-86]|nr:MAG: hypothetical protein ABS81_06035 [Pseudonocardia sp. SCN 72-86]
MAAHHDGRVGRVRLQRPDKRNAVDTALAEEAALLMRRLAAAGIDVALLEAEPPTFCAGHDLSEMGAGTLETGAMRLIEELNDSDLFWIACVNGPVVGAGLGILATCPMVIATTDAWFSLPEADLGFFPGGMFAGLENIIPVRKLMDMAMTGRRVPAAEAMSWGLVDEVVDPADLMSTAEGIAASLASRPELVRLGRVAWRNHVRDATYRDRHQSLLGPALQAIAATVGRAEPA